METPPPQPPLNYATPASVTLDIGRCLNEALAVYHKNGIVLVERNMSITEAMTASWRIVLRNGLGWNLLLSAIIFALALVPAFVPYFGWIVAWFFAPITWLMVSSAYIQQVRERESELADIL